MKDCWLIDFNEGSKRDEKILFRVEAIISNKKLKSKLFKKKWQNKN